MANRKVYLLTEEQMNSITTKLSALSRYVDAENSRTLTLALAELNRAETISSDEYFTTMVDKILDAMGVEFGRGWKGGAK